MNTEVKQRNPVVRRKRVMPTESERPDEVWHSIYKPLRILAYYLENLDKEIAPTLSEEYILS